LIICQAMAIAAEPTTQGATTLPTTRSLYIYIDAKVNGQPVRLLFDTECEETILHRTAADRLKLKVIAPSTNVVPRPGFILVGRTEECQLSIAGLRSMITPRVEFLPKTTSYLTGDGALGWGSIRHAIWEIQFNERRAFTLADLPEDIARWTKYKLVQDATVLAFMAGANGARTDIVIIDTGADSGVELGEDRWKKWRRDHAENPATVEGSWMPALGWVVSELCWADELTIGSFSVNNVPVVKSPVHETGVLKDYQARIGAFALTRYDVIVDGEDGSIYFRPVQAAQSGYRYSRAGAIFVPGGNNGDDLIARVIKPSPAYEGGIRDGDILLKIDDLDMTKWRTDKQAYRSIGAWSARPPGTKIRLTIQREGKTFETTVELKDILGLEAKQRGTSRPSTSASEKRSELQPGMVP
jgi:hypothetical protein